MRCGDSPPLCGYGMYDENEPFDSYDEEYEQWLDECYASAQDAIDQEQYEMQETTKMLAGGLI